MGKKTLFAVILAAAFLTVIVLDARNRSEAQPAPQVQRWEYATLSYTKFEKMPCAWVSAAGVVTGSDRDIFVALGGKADPAKSPMTIEIINLAGSLGWDLFQVSDMPGQDTTEQFHFKRRLP